MTDNENQFQRFINGKRIYLREVRISDVNEDYYRWLNDTEVNQYLETRYIPRSLRNIREFVEKLDGNSDEILLAICLKENDMHIGNIKLGPINWIHRFADMSLLIGEKQYWGKSFATEAIKILSGFAFHVLNLNKLRSGCYADNVGSAKAFLKAGFIQEGILRNQWMAGGNYQDELIFGFSVLDWKNHD